MGKKKKKKSRIRQTRTAFQKVFDRHPGMIQPFSWPDRLPEFLHISIALIENDFEKVRTDFFEVADYVNSKHKPTPKFHFNLSHSIAIIAQDKEFLNIILKTCFANAFDLLLQLYQPLFGIDIADNPKTNPKLILAGYKSISNGRSPMSITAKYLMMHYLYKESPDPFGIFSKKTQEEILDPQNISQIMSAFSPSVGQSSNLNLKFCRDLWMFNYLNIPPMIRPSSKSTEEQRFEEMKISNLKDEFNELYMEFRKVNLIVVYSRRVAELNMGFVSRVCNLGLQVVDFVETHKGEVAELTARSALETKPIRVVVPFAVHLELPEKLLQPLRSYGQLITFIKSVALLHQYQLKTKRDAQGNEYIEATVDHLEIAVELLKDILLRQSDELGSTQRDMLEKLKTFVGTKEKTFRIPEVLKALRLSKSSFYREFNLLRDKGYVEFAGGNKGKGIQYRIGDWEEYDTLKQSTDILTTQIKRIKEASQRIPRAFPKTLNSRKSA